MKKSIGIDLGTTNTVVAFKDTVIKIIRNEDKEELTRSCVGLHNEEILVGRKAYQLLCADPINTILSVKRLMGGAIKDKMIIDKINSNYFKFGITSLKGGTDDAVAVILGGKQYTPEQISAKILKKVKEDAEEKLGGEITHAVITVPAYFTEKQKNATRIAAQLAGIKVQKLLAEPTAAAIAYSIDNLKAGDSKTVMIYDFGGGTFDLSILNIVDGQYMEAGTGGDRWLGGDDIDIALLELVYLKIVTDARLGSVEKLKELIEKMPNDSKKHQGYNFEAELKNSTENAKKQLSSSNTADVTTSTDLVDENGEWIPIDITITRQELETVIKPFITRSIELIVVLLKEVGYDISMIDSILLVGGTSCIPLVKRMLSEKFGANKIKVSEKPMLAVAEGAAILSHRLGDEYETVIGNEPEVVEISYSTNHNYYIEVANGIEFKMERVIEKQIPLPVEVSKYFKTTTNNQKMIKVAIYSDAEDKKYELQTLGFYLIEDNLPIQSEIILDFKLDLNELLSVTVYPKGKKNQAKLLVLGRGYKDQKALKTIDELIEKSVREFRTLAGEEELLKYISQRIKEIDTLGSSEIDDNKWSEIYYTTTEKYEEIKRSEQGSSEENRAVGNAIRLINEFGDLLDQFDKKTIINLITQIDSSIDELEKANLVITLKEKTENYNLLNAALNIEPYSDRILNIPGTPIGINNKQNDVNRLKKLSIDIITNYKMGQKDLGTTFLDEAYSIIDTYKGSL